MRKITLTNVMLSAALMFSAIGCVEPELDADTMDPMKKDQSPAVVPACDFSSAEILVGTPYTVSIVYDKLDIKKTYLVEISLAGTLKSQNANVAQKGLMRVPVTPEKVGQGTISVYETKVKKDKMEKNLATTCSFVAQAKPVVDEPIDDDPIIDDPIIDDPIIDDPIIDDPIDDDPIIDDTGQNNGGCQICPPGTPIYKSPVCTHIVNAAPSFEQGSSDCKSIIEMARGSGCCGNGPPDPCDFEPPKVDYVGPHPPCDLCRDGDYPYNTGMVINFLYLGAGSCAQYYKYGLQGHIPSHMCAPVQYFAYEPCGCGEFNLREKQCKEKE